MGVARIRTLGENETEGLLDLLDGWPFPAGESGREFFRRYVELDPAFEPRNVWVAEQQGQLVSCVQIFPRQVRVGGKVLPMGGVGSVFTRPERRTQGLAGALLERAHDSMRERGMLLSYLYAERLAWYGHYGWRPWSAGVRTLDWPQASAFAGTGAARLLAPVTSGVSLPEASELKRLWRLYAEGSGGKPPDGIVHRASEADWSASLALAGTPDEDIWLACDQDSARPGARQTPPANAGPHSPAAPAAGPDGQPASAYLRVATVGERLRVLEWGREQDGAWALCGLLAAALHRQGSRSIRLPLVRDRSVEAELAAAGARIETRPAWNETPPGRRPPATWMVRSLNEDELARRCGLSGDGDVLARCLPFDRFAFWEADRF